MLYKAGDEGATQVYEMYNFFEGKFNLATVASICVTGNRTTGMVNESIDNLGSVPVTYKEKAFDVLCALNDSTIPDRFLNRTVIALAYISESSGIEPQVITRRVSKNLNKWLTPKSVDETRRSIVNCYNYCLAENNKISHFK